MSKAQWVALATIPGVGGKTISALRDHFGDLDAVFEASITDLRQVRGVGPKISQTIKAIDLAQVETDIDRFEAEGIQIITALDNAQYPARLMQGLDDWPPVIFARGQLVPRVGTRWPHLERRQLAHHLAMELARRVLTIVSGPANWPPAIFPRGRLVAHVETPAVAIVGTRWPRPERRELAHQLAMELARRGLTIVSGLALGIDTAAHRGALEAHGRTIAVLGCGLKRIYPEENIPLADEIAQAGAVISETHPEMAVAPQRLVARNRIISGLSRAVIVVEAGEDSGSLIAARRAWDQGRKVFAVQGGDKGCEALIAEGAGIIDPDEPNWDDLARRLIVD